MDADSLVFKSFSLLRRKKLLLVSKLTGSLLCHDDVFEFSDIEALGIAETWWAVGFVTIHAAEAILISRNHGLASRAFDTILVVLVWRNHSLSSLILRAASESINALLVLTQTETLFGSAESHEVFSDVIHHVKMMSLQFFNVIVFHALVSCKLTSAELFTAYLTLDHNFRAVSLNMHEKLLPGHMLKVFMIANVTAEFWAIIDGVLLEFFHGFPYDLTVFIVLVTFMREFTEVNAVLENLVNWLQKVTSSLAMWAANVISWSNSGFSRSDELRLLSSLHLSSVSFSLPWWHLCEHIFRKFELFWVGVLILVVRLQFGEVIGLLKLDLAIFTEQFVAVFAFHWFIWELQAHNALNFLSHLSLEFILNLIHFDVELRDWLWSHNPLNSSIGNQHVLHTTFKAWRLRHFSSGYSSLSLWALVSRWFIIFTTADHLTIKRCLSNIWRHDCNVLLLVSLKWALASTLVASSLVGEGTTSLVSTSRVHHLLVHSRVLNLLGHQILSGAHCVS